MNYLKGFLHGRCQEPRYVPDDYMDSLVPRALKVKQGEKWETNCITCIPFTLLSVRLPRWMCTIHKGPIHMMKQEPRRLLVRHLWYTRQVRIQDLVKGGPASEAKSCRRSEAESCERSEQSAARVQGPLKGPGSFWGFDAQICILTHSRDSFSLIFDIYFDTKSW